MAMQQRTLGDRRERKLGAIGDNVCDILFEQQRVISEAARLFVFQQRRNFIAEAVETAWLKTNHGNTAIDVGRKRAYRALGFPACLVDAPDRQKRAPAAERPVAHRRDMHATSGGLEHVDRSLDVLRLEIAIEGVDE